MVNSRELEGLERVIVLGRGAAAAGAAGVAARGRSTGKLTPDWVDNYLKDINHTNNMVTLFGVTMMFVAKDEIENFANRVLNSESKGSDAKQGDNNDTESSNVEKGTYGHLKEPKTVGDGKKTTPSQRKRILEENKRQNEGELTSDGDGRKLNPPTKTKKGEKADMNQAEVDHKKAKSKGGSNSNSNLRVVSKEENLKKGNR